MQSEGKQSGLCRERCEGGRQGMAREEAGGGVRGAGRAVVAVLRVWMVPGKPFCTLCQKEPL